MNERIKLMFIMTERRLAEKYIERIDELGANFNHLIYARGTAKSGLLEVLGIGEEEKVINLCVVKESDIEKVKEIIEKLDKKKHVKTLAFTIPITTVGGPASYTILSGADFKEEKSADKKSKDKLRKSKIKDKVKPYKKGE